MIAEGFKHGMRRMTGAVTIVTIKGSAGERRGVTATAVCSLSFNPPSLLACINRDANVGRMVPTAGAFCVNVLAAHQLNIAEVFAGRSARVGEQRFDVGSWHEGASGAPVLEGALVSFECNLQQFISAGTHLILIGHVRNTLLSEGAIDPLLYLDGAFTGVGLPIGA